MGIISFFKNIFKKEITYSCLIWDGKTMTYLNLTQKQIDQKLLSNKNLVITKKDDIL